MIQRLFPILLFLFSVPAMAAQVPDSIAAIAGRYTGMAFNGNDLDPVVTVLSFDDQGRFTGSYRIDDESGTFEGNLSGLTQDGDYSYSMEWTDRDGEGFLMLEFSSDYSSFNGVWTDTGGLTARPYNGRRQ